MAFPFDFAQMGNGRPRPTFGGGSWPNDGARNGQGFPFGFGNHTQPDWPPVPRSGSPRPPFDLDAARQAWQAWQARTGSTWTPGSGVPPPWANGGNPPDFSPHFPDHGGGPPVIPPFPDRPVIPPPPDRPVIPQPSDRPVIPQPRPLGQPAPIMGGPPANPPANLGGFGAPNPMRAQALARALGGR